MRAEHSICEYETVGIHSNHWAVKG